MDELLFSQEMDGSWEIQEGILKAMGVTVEQVTGSAPEKVSSLHPLPSLHSSLSLSLSLVFIRSVNRSS